MDAVESVAAETPFGEYTVDASFAMRGVGALLRVRESGCTRDAKGERKRDAGSPNEIGPTSSAVSRDQQRCCYQVDVTCNDLPRRWL